MQSRMGPVRSPQAAWIAAAEVPRTPHWSGKNRLSMNAFRGLGDHFDRERGPDGGFEAANVRGQVLCKGNGFRRA